MPTLRRAGSAALCLAILASQTLLVDSSASAAKKTTKAAKVKPKTTLKGVRPPNQLAWAPCVGAVECADLRVPIDPADPSLGTTRIAVGRILARNPSQRRGVLFVNPGGPGGSAIRLVASIADSRTRGPLGSGFDNWDVIGVDPRGVGRSDPIRCGTQPTDLGLDPFNTTSSDEQRKRVRQEFIAACLRQTGPLFTHAGTVDMADDLERVRIALGETSIDYLGYSYGTAIGSAYAAKYGASVKSMVLDAPIDPSQYGGPFLAQNAAAFESRLQDFAQVCASSRGCLYRTDERQTPEAIIAAIQTLLRTFDAAYGPTRGLNVRSVFYDTLEESADWADAAQLLNIVESFTKTPDLKLPTLPASESFQLLSNPLFWANTCTDGRYPTTAEGFASTAQTITTNSPTLGTLLIQLGDLCVDFPAVRPVPSNVSTAAKPILIIGGTKDSRTTPIWATGLGAAVGNAVVVFREGDGHVSYTRSSCIRQMVEAYMIRSEIPASGTVCPTG